MKTAKSTVGQIDSTQPTVVQIGSPESPRYFTLAEANQTLPLVKQITRDSYEELEVIKKKLRNFVPSDPRVVLVERQYEEIVKKWISKLERLGLIVKGLWLVDFDTGDGYLCWKYPELEVSHYHSYTGGFAARRPVSEIIEESHPNWA